MSLSNIVTVPVGDGSMRTIIRRGTRPFGDSL